MAFTKSENSYTIRYRSLLLLNNEGMIWNTIYLWYFIVYGVVVEYTTIVNVDNIGDIFLSDNTSESPRKKHIDVRHHFICDYIEDGTVNINFS